MSATRKLASLRVDLSARDSGKSTRPRDSLSIPSPLTTQSAAGSCVMLTNVTPPLPSRFNIGKSHSEATSAGKAKGKRLKEKKKEARTEGSTSATSPTQLQEAHLHGISTELLSKWETSFDALLKHPEGMEFFEAFLKSEFSEENILFWRSCERYKTLPEHLVEREAAIIFEEFVAPQAPKLVNIDHQTTKEIGENMKRPDRGTFLRAQQSIYLLMARDSFVRFIKSEPFQKALKR